MRYSPFIASQGANFPCSFVPGRRTLLRSGVVGACGLTLAEFLMRREARSAPSGVGGSDAPAARARSVLLIYTMGGISHHDTFDPKPAAPPEIRGEFSTIATALPGIAFSEHVPRLARDLGRYALIRSVQHEERDHGVSAYYMLRGYVQPTPAADRPENQRSTNPNIGSHVARLLPAQSVLPPYIVVPGLSYLAQISYYTAGWMGRAYDPFILRSDPNKKDFDAGVLVTPRDVPADRLAQRRSLARTIESPFRRSEVARPLDDYARHQARAMDMLSSVAARRAFDLSAESEATRDAYGRTRLGQGCLAARRLVEAGVPFVTVDDDGWDHHGNVFPGLRQRLPELDQSFTALLDDLSQRGLLESTLVLLLTDFGRTPVINASAGRDHWPGVFSVLLAGAGIRGGQVIGSSDRHGALPSSRPVSPKDLAATIYRFLGLDPFQPYPGPDGRPLMMLDEGTALAEL